MILFFHDAKELPLTDW